MNPNDTSAHLYDKTIASLRPQFLTDSEIEVITARFDKGSKILDVGGGTGRHALILAKLGYEVTVVDSSKEMIRNLEDKAKEQKIENIKTFAEDIFEIHLKLKEYDMAILLWNSFNEMALNRKHAVVLLSKLKSVLTRDGKILINIDNADNVNPAKFDFTSSRIVDGLEYKQHWTTSEYFKKSNTSISKEQIQVIDGTGKVLQEQTAFIKQKYWRLTEIKEICDELKLKIERVKLSSNNELYLLIS